MMHDVAVVEPFDTGGSVVLGELVGARAMSATPLGVSGGLATVSAGWLSFGSSEAQSMKTKSVSVEPSFDVFVADGVSLGAQIGAGVWRTSFAGNDSTGDVWYASAMPRIGRTITLSGEVAWWPRIAAGMTMSEGPGDQRATKVVRATFDAPFVFRLARHVLFVVGPSLSYFETLSGSDDARGLVGGVSAGLSLAL